MIFTELDEATREWMLRRFESEESGGNPRRSEVLSQLGLAHWPDVMRQAITDPDGSEVTLAAALNRPDYWQATETYVRNGISRQRSVNPTQASETTPARPTQNSGGSSTPTTKSSDRTARPSGSRVLPWPR